MKVLQWSKTPDSAGIQAVIPVVRSLSLHDEKFSYVLSVLYNRFEMYWRFTARHKNGGVVYSLKYPDMNSAVTAAETWADEMIAKAANSLEKSRNRKVLQGMQLTEARQQINTFLLQQAEERK